MHLLESILSSSPLLGQLFTMASPRQKALTADTPPLSQGSNTGTWLTNSGGLQAPPPTPRSPAEDPHQPKRRRLVRITSPEPGSLFDILHDNQGESLFIYPICWTDAHARLLDVQFVRRKSIRKPTPDFNSKSSRYPPRPSSIAAEISKDLTTILGVSPSDCTDTAAIKQVMSIFFPAALSQPKSTVDFALHFGGRTIKRAVRVAVLWTHPETSPGTSFDSATTKPASSCGRVTTSGSQVSNWNSINSLPEPDRPILAWVNRSHLAMVRRNLYRVAPIPDTKEINVPVQNLQKVRSKRLIPQVKDHDSYLVAIMLAIAQSHFYPPSVSSKESRRRSSLASKNDFKVTAPQPEFRDVPVRILSQDCDSAELVVYSTTVTAAFLRRFADPMKAPSADALHNSGLKVDVTRVPVWPVLGLKERLAQALGAGISGEDPSQAASDAIETWESQEERSKRGAKLKRRREIMTEVFNTSFDLDDDNSVRKPSFSGATSSRSASPRTPKRRRTEAASEPPAPSEMEVC